MQSVDDGNDLGAAMLVVDGLPEALELIGPIGLDEVREKASFSVKWRDRGWGLDS